MNWHCCLNEWRVKLICRCPFFQSVAVSQKISLLNFYKYIEGFEAQQLSRAHFCWVEFFSGQKENRRLASSKICYMIIHQTKWSVKDGELYLHFFTEVHLSEGPEQLGCWWFFYKQNQTFWPLLLGCRTLSNLGFGQFPSQSHTQYRNCGISRLNLTAAWPEAELTNDLNIPSLSWFWHSPSLPSQHFLRLWIVDKDIEQVLLLQDKQVNEAMCFHVSSAPVSSIFGRLQ